MKFITALALIAVSVVAVADNLVWPADYWQSVTNRMNAVAPDGTASKALEGFDSRPYVSASNGMAADSEEFDSRPYVTGVSNGISMNSLPLGLTIVVR